MLKYFRCFGNVWKRARNLNKKKRIFILFIPIIFHNPYFVIFVYFEKAEASQVAFQVLSPSGGGQYLVVIIYSWTLMRYRSHASASGEFAAGRPAKRRTIPQLELMPQVHHNIRWPFIEQTSSAVWPTRYVDIHTFYYYFYIDESKK